MGQLALGIRVDGPGTAWNQVLRDSLNDLEMKEFLFDIKALSA